jgi:UDP-N-acetyl-D-mannosaminuronic acid dehydrogenase
MVKMSQYDICVLGGGGHAGLPLSIAFADKGKRVIISDKNKDILQTIGKGIMPFIEKGADKILKRVIHKKLFLSQELSAVKDCAFVIVVIDTPIDKHLNPTYKDWMLFFEQLKPFLKKDQIVILRSTIYPGITQKIQKLFGSTAVCFCPERIAEGKAMEELLSLPQIVSGFDPVAIRKAGKLFNLLTKDIIYLDPLEAELAKLFTNSWRYVQFAVANQFFMIAQEYGADFYTIYNAMTYNYPRARYFPKPGFTAGPCLLKDTMQIAAFTNHKFFLGHGAMLINEGLPNFIMDQLKKYYNLSRMTVGILGMAFKAESDDKRESLSYKLKKLAYLEAKAVLCSDAYIEDNSFVDEQTLIKKSDIIIIGAPHHRYNKLNFKGKILVDIWDHVNQGKKRRP